MDPAGLRVRLVAAVKFAFGLFDISRWRIRPPRFNVLCAVRAGEEPTFSVCSIKSAENKKEKKENKRRDAKSLEIWQWPADPAKLAKPNLTCRREPAKPARTSA